MLRLVTISGISLPHNVFAQCNVLKHCAKLDKLCIRLQNSRQARNLTTQEAIPRQPDTNDGTILDRPYDDPEVVTWRPVPVQQESFSNDDLIRFKSERPVTVRRIDATPYTIRQPSKPSSSRNSSKKLVASAFPTSCPGCGAASQTTNHDAPGFYRIPSLEVPAPTESGKTRRMTFLAKKEREEAIFNKIVSGLDKQTLEEMDVLEQEDADGVPITTLKDIDKIVEASVQGKNTEDVTEEAADDLDPSFNVISYPDKQQEKPPLCARCHSLVHHHMAAPIATVNYASITQPIAECEYSRIHIYHVVDAADFPMSLLPNVKRNILRHLPAGFRKHKLDFSFIVTRADLLMAKESMVTRLMTYLRTVLKEALPEEDTIGDIRVVSAKQAWTTEKIKEDIRKQKGGVFLIGRTNVGKSRLFDSIYPRKSSMIKHGLNPGAFGKQDGVEVGGLAWPSDKSADEGISAILETTKPIPIKYPEMPTVSDIPGTTVGPVKVEIGNGQGELVDLPGLERGKLFEYVRPDCIKNMVMTNRIVPEQCVVKPGQCLLLGGIIKMTTVTPDVIFMAYPFLTLPAHVTSIAKAPTYLNHPDPASNPLLFNFPASEHLLSTAGAFTLAWEVTHARNAKLKNIKKGIVEKLPYRIYSIDILVEGCGWVEIVAQMRLGQEPPVIEVSSPMGLGIGSRMPMGAQMLSRKPVKKPPPGARPRKSMKGVKKTMKLKRRSSMSND